MTTLLRRLSFAFFVANLAWCPAASFGADSDSTATLDSTAVPKSTATLDSTVTPDSTADVHQGLHAPLDAAAEALGLENVTADPSGAQPRVAYENRRYRHTMDAYGWLERGQPQFVAFERRLGMVAAAIERDGTGPGAGFRVLYPSDAKFPAPPRGPLSGRTSHSLDLLAGPLFAYDLGRVTDPIQLMFQAEVTARWNPWPGSRLSGSVVFPIYNDFVEDPLHPDVDNVRPGLVTAEQFAWIPRTALTSATVGVFADNRYGFSLGAARPMFGGSVLLDAQTDLTGFIAFQSEGVEYSPLENWSTFGGVVYRPPWLDIAVRARYAQFLYGDHGAEIDFRRALGDFDLGFSVLRSKNLTIETVRIVFPVPPLTRPTRQAIRALPVERFPISFRTDATLVGQSVVGVGSREDFLRHLATPTLETNRWRYDRAQGRGGRPGLSEPPPWANHSGMTGFIITPWAGVQPDGSVEVGFTNIPKEWAYNPEGIQRGVYHNEIYYASLGLLPRLELGMRITRTPGFNPFADIDPESQLTTDTDHMVSARVALIEPREGRLGLAVGVEDLQGTRRYNSSYLVTGLPLTIFRVQNRFSLGYASRVFTASRHVLDGVFGAVEVSPWRAVAARFEYDTEKFNVGLGVDLGFGLRVRAAALNMESLSAGVGWHHKL